MPTYDYECSECGHEFESFHAMSAKPLLSCPECLEPKLVKLIGPGVAVIVRGTENRCSGTRGKKTRPVPKKLDRLGEGKNKVERPFWRDGSVNKGVLKNPERYIKEGKVD